jgi:DNA-binding IclR family transcriptional regulator
MAFARASRNAISTSLTPFRNAAAIPQQEHELIHEKRNRGYFAWQGALQSDVRASVIMRYRHSETTLVIAILLSMTEAIARRPIRRPWL